MPKTKEEKETLASFISEYGEERGKRIYYSKRNKSPDFDRSQGGGFSSKKAQAEWWYTRIEKLPLHLKSKVIGLIEVDQNVDWWMKRIKAVELNKAKHEGHLVTDSKGNQHLPTHSNGKPNHRLMGAAWAALHEGYRGNKYSGPNKSQAISKLKKLYAREGLKTPSEGESHTR